MQLLGSLAMTLSLRDSAHHSWTVQAKRSEINWKMLQRTIQLAIITSELTNTKRDKGCGRAAIWRSHQQLLCCIVGCFQTIAI